MKRFTALLLACMLLWCHSAVWAASKMYVAPETALKFADSAQSGVSATLTMSALGPGAGQMSAQFDRGAGAHAAWYERRCTITLSGTNVVNTTIEWWIATSLTADGTNTDGQLVATTASFATDKRNNLQFAGLTIVDQTTTNTPMTSSTMVYITSRYIALGAWNATGLSFQTSTSAHTCWLTPMPPEME